MSQKKSLPAGCRCLVLEDEFLIALDIQDALEAAGAASVSCFSSAEKAIAALNSGATFDVGILDMNLSGDNRTGLSVAAELSTRGTPFIFLTGMPHDSARANGYDVPFLEKPYQQATLLEAVHKVLALDYG